MTIGRREVDAHAELGGAERGGAEHAAVVVDAPSSQLHRLPVDQEAGASTDLDRAQADPQTSLVEHLVSAPKVSGAPRSR